MHTVHVYACVYVHTYIFYMNTDIHISMHTRYVCMYSYVYIYIFIFMHVCMYITALPQLVSPMAQVSGYTQLFQKSHKYDHQNCQCSCHQQMEEPASAVGPVYCQNNNNFSHISGNAAKQVVQKSYVSI